MRGGTHTAGHPLCQGAASFGGRWQHLMGMKCPQPIRSLDAHLQRVRGKDGATEAHQGHGHCTAGVVEVTHWSPLMPPTSHGMTLGGKMGKGCNNTKGKNIMQPHWDPSSLHMFEPAGPFHVMFGITVEGTWRR